MAAKKNSLHIRNIGIAAHIDAGKTTLTERILFYSGKTHRIGEVDEGSATMDWMEQERERGITITSAATSTKWRNHTINIIDTPGHVDFTVEVQRSLRALDSMIAVFCAVGGVEPQSETVWRQANQYEIPRIAFVNKLDRTGADFSEAVKMMKENLDARACPIAMPFGEGNDFKGIIDIIDRNMIIYHDETQGREFGILDIPDELKSQVDDLRWELLDSLSEDDEELTEMILEEKEIPTEKIRACIRNSTINHKFVPVLCGSALRNRGVQPVMDGVIDYLPAPEDIGEVTGSDPKTGKPVTFEMNEDEPLSAVVFKIASDKYVGRISYGRIYSGKMDLKHAIFNPRAGKRERANKIFHFHSDQRTEIDIARAGDVVGIAGLRFSKTGDTLCDLKRPVFFGEMHFPEPVIFVAIEPKSQADMPKLTKVLEQLQDEDPTVEVKINEETGQMILSGMGELHLEILVDRMMKEFSLDARVGNPQVAYRETITKTAKETGIFNKKIGDIIQYASVTIEVFPLKKADDTHKTGKKFINDVPKNFQIDDAFVEAIKESVLASAESGPIGGYLLNDVGIRLTDVEYNEDSTTELAFRIAAGNAFSQAIRNAGAVLLEPMMKIEILLPDSYVGDVISDLGMRGAQVQGIEQKGDLKKITAIAPLSEMFGYTTSLRSHTQGRGTYSMEFDSFQRLSGSREENLMKKIRGY
ncbi:MAG: elongation factor G [Candidatus Zixiibacteriota bacterium]